MFSANFYYRLNYQLRNGANVSVFNRYIKDRLLHPFLSSKKKYFAKKHKDYLKEKKTTTDYFSINAYYWNSIIKKNFKDFSYLEVGSWEGNSALYILKNFNTKRVVCVDIWDLHNDKFKKEHLERYKNFKHNLNEFEQDFSFFKNTSDIFFKNNKENFDLIYIDGSHEARQVYKDLLNSWNCLNENGMIICDDYFYGDLYSNENKDIPAVSINKFLNENKKKIKIICVNNTQIFFKKIK
tara:strand:+ start:1093 stop:1809 length:717 start_codon:yes stop_codon:yes gene_type:complete